MTAYGGIVEEYNDMIQTQMNNSKQATETGISDNLNDALAQFKEDADEYAHKYSALAEGGVGEIMGAAGLAGAYEKYKKIMEIKSDLEKKTEGLRKRLGLADDPEKAVGEAEQPDIQMSEIGQILDDEPESVAPAPTARAPPVDLGVDVGEPELASNQGTLNPFADAVRIPAEPAQPEEDLEDIVERNLRDTTEGVGGEVTQDVDTSGGFTTGLTGRGGTAIEEARAAAREAQAQPEVSGDAVSIFERGVAEQRRAGNVRQALVTRESETPSFTKELEPIDVQGLGVRRAAPELELRLGGRARPSLLEDRPQPAQPGEAVTIQQRGFQQQLLEEEVREPVAEESLDEAFKPIKIDEPEPEPEEEIQPAAEPKAETGPDVVAPVEDDLAKQAGEESGEKIAEETSAEAGAEIGGEIAEETTIGSFAGPVGESIAAVAGVATAISGLVHLFEHHSNVTTAPTNLGNLDPEISSRLTSKFAVAIPTIDSAHEQSASVSSF